MKKLAVLCIAALGAALLVFGTAPAASAYPELTCTVDVSPQVLKPGQQFTVTGKAAGVDSTNHAIDPASVQWTFAWNGVTKTRSGSPASVKFTAPQVTRTKVIPLTVRSTSAAGDCVRHFDVTVLAAAAAAPHAGGSGLPGTGGPTVWLLVAGLVLLLGGGGAVVSARRRS
jgi:LPXTG-motif cell wall-anchored protein